MPTTINGVGTHYYGRSNSETRTSLCRSCGRTGALVSYDTRLWFVIVFIPVIPLGRKRILDQCPSCRRHYVVDAVEWETQKQLNVSGALERYQREGTPEAAMEAHQQMLNFRQTGEAAELRREMAERFRQNARVQAYLGQALAGIGRADDGLLYFQRALELRPDLPEARVGIAYDHMRHQRLPEARALLDFLEKPGAAQLYSLEPLENLAYAYLHVGKHAEALELFQVLLQALPALGSIRRFRNSVQACERALKRKTSILPKWKFSWNFKRNPGGQRAPRAPLLTWRGLIIVGGIAGAIALISLLVNEHTRRHRTLYLVNGFHQPALVEIRGVGSTRVVGGDVEMDLPEGHYHASVTGPVHEEFDFDVQADFFDRWGDHAVWLLNVGGSALVLETHSTYQAGSPPPPTFTAHFGKPLEKITGITHPFKPLPDSIQMKQGEQQTLTQLDLYRGSVEGLSAYLRVHGAGAEALRFAEWRLKTHPDDDEALSSFIAIAPAKEAEDFLRAGLDRRPIALTWHRAYQDLHRTGAWLQWVAVEYDGMLAADPQNATLLYLRGRVASSHDAEKWMEKAHAADAKNPYPLFGLAYQRVATGDWAGAKSLYQQGLALDPSREEFARLLVVCRMALGEFSDLEKELKARLARDAHDFSAAGWLVNVLAAQKRSTEAAAVVTAFQKSIGDIRKPEAAAVIMALKWQLLYGIGDLAGLEKTVAGDRSPASREVLFTALIEQGKVVEAERIHSLTDPKLDDPYRCIVMSLAWLRAGDRAKADAWFNRGMELLVAGSPDEAQAARLFDKKANPTAEAWRDPRPCSWPRAGLCIPSCARICLRSRGNSTGRRANLRSLCGASSEMARECCIDEDCQRSKV